MTPGIASASLSTTGDRPMTAYTDDGAESTKYGSAKRLARLLIEQASFLPVLGLQIASLLEGSRQFRDRMALLGTQHLADVAARLLTVRGTCRSPGEGPGFFAR